MVYTVVVRMPLIRAMVNEQSTVLVPCRRLTGLEAGRLRDEQQQLTATIKDLQVCCAFVCLWWACQGCG